MKTNNISVEPKSISDMNKENLIDKFANEFVTVKQLDEIWEREDVDSVVSNGSSGYQYGSLWYTVNFNNADDMDVYVEMKGGKNEKT